MEAFRTALRLAPDDPLGASLELARLDAAVAIDAAPPAYVAALFDAYAASFDKALVERLDYAAPQLIAAALKALPRDVETNGGRRFSRVLDLGCGTGLMGEALVAEAGFLAGVDLSANMIAEARGKGVYDALEQADLLAVLLDDAAAYDLIVAADVLIYTGDLAPVMAAAAARLGPGGLLAFTVEIAGAAGVPEAGDWTIGPSLRFRHSASYLQRVIAAAGLSVIRMETVTLRKDAGADVSGYLVIALKENLSAPPQQDYSAGSVSISLAGASTAAGSSSTAVGAGNGIGLSDIDAI
jgi:predicted TPR repeat methyltransferase